MTLAVACDKDPLECPAGGLNDVTAVQGGRRQSGCRLIAVIGLAGGERTGATNTEMCRQNCRSARASCARAPPRTDGALRPPACRPVAALW